MITPSSLAGRPLATLVPRPRPAAATARLADPATLPVLDPRRPWPGREITAGGVTLHVRETPGPDGVPAVYVHGLAGSATNWTDLAGLLSPRAAGTAVDLPGFGGPGRSPCPTGRRPGTPTPCSASWPAAGSACTCSATRWAGCVALAVAARRPELVETLTLISPAMPDRRPDPRRILDPRMLLAAVPGRIGRRSRAELRRDDATERAAHVVELCFGDPSVVPEHRLREVAEEIEERSRGPWAARRTTRRAGDARELGPRAVAVAARRARAGADPGDLGRPRPARVTGLAGAPRPSPRGRLQMLPGSGTSARSRPPTPSPRRWRGCGTTSRPGTGKMRGRTGR